MTKAKPFLKWTGGKRQLLPELLKRVPASYGTYHEPFVGGGALFFALQPKVANLSDINVNLLKTYRAVRDYPENLIGILREKYADSNTSDFFYAVRDRRPDAVLDVAAWMIYLNRTCFNGLWRVNKKGMFNVPFGKHANPTICDAENLRLCSVALHPAIIRLEPFEAVCDRVLCGDFVYFDPPYVPLTTTSSFVGYTSGGFGLREQEKLRDVALTLKRRGVHVLLSNSGSAIVEKLYGADFEMAQVQARRSINETASKRGKIMEYLIS